MSASDEGRCVADRYELGELLGRGGMGAVWRAQDLVLQRPVAVKEIAFPPSIPPAEREALRNRLMREARAAARLSHPSVTTVFDVVVEDETPYLVMELVEAPTLTDLVRSDGPLEPRRAAAIGLEVLGALEVAHRAGIVHRDVKPGNIMVPSAGPAKLADFGIASLADDSNITTTGSVLGSPSFIAPEQANSSTSGPPADLWGLGASLYFAVEGVGPFERGQALPTLSAVLRDPPRPMQQAGALAPAIEALLVKDPDQRATMGCSSGAAAALSMAWYRTDLYHRVISYSGTYVNQQWPWHPETPGGAWHYHRTLIPGSPRKPLRIWMHVGDRDLFNPNVMRDSMHDWVEANERMARVLAEKGYPYQFVFVRNAGHCDRAVKQQTLPAALGYVWSK